MSDIAGPVHLIGIGGMHMSAIAQLLMEQGVRISGSDLRPSALTTKLQSLGATIAFGHAAGNVPADAATVVFTAAAADDNPELVEARRRGLPTIIRAEMVAKLMEGKRVVAVAGAHGKTTTSSLIAFILVKAGREPMYLLGGESRDLGGHASWGNGDICVVEADEYKRAFHEYTPAIAVITNVEPDHLDYYGTAEAYQEAFVEFGKRVPEGGLILACADDPGARYVIWHHQEEPAFAFAVAGQASLHPWLLPPSETLAGCPRYVALPGGRAGLLDFKLRRCPPWRGRLAWTGWEFVKFRHLRQLAGQPGLNVAAFRARIGLDPIITLPGQQLALFPMENQGDPDDA